MIYLDNRESVKVADSFLFYKNKEEKGYYLPELGYDSILTSSQWVVNLCKSEGYQYKTLSEYFGFQVPMGLFEVFSNFFEGKVRDDFDMIEALFDGFIEDSPWCFCLKVGVTFCWFRVDKSRIHKLGTMQFSEPMSKYTVGRFIKRLRYNIVKSGINLNRVTYLVWSESDIYYEFSSYILSYTCLSTFFSKIE